MWDGISREEQQNEQDRKVLISRIRQTAESVDG